MSNDNVAQRFADALDAENYESAQSLLADDCVYESRAKVITGPDAIIRSYRANSLFARTLFDRVEYTNDLSEIDSNSARVTLIDTLHKGGRKHVYRCHQTVHVRPDGLIDRIEHHEIPGERKQLLEFCTSCNVDLI